MVIGALRQRWATLRRIGEFVIEKQRDYLVYGPLQFKRISRSEAARELRLHESTISRAVRDKVLQLPNGHLTSLEQLFDPSMAAREAVRSILEDHGGALCDRKIAEILNARGVNISRRTITKYRHEIGLKPGRRQYTAL
jgi:RNA polymerase sigma-54 factor